MITLWYNTTEVIITNYAIYKNARNASWNCLIDCDATELPVKPVQIALHYDINCTYSDTLQHDGEIGYKDGKVSIAIRRDQLQTRQRYTIMHELGHYLLGHLGDTPLSRSRSSVRPEEEQAAERFAADVLMPACVLWALNIHTAQDIAKLCNVSPPAAARRAARMEVLYQRDKFLSHPLERQVFQQFQNYINSFK